MTAQAAQSGAAVATSSATAVRWRIMGLLALTTAIATLGRADLGITGKYVQDEFAFSTETMGWIFAAFAFAYHPFQIPGGWAGDRFGPRKVLAASILFWAAATAVMAMAPGSPIGRWLGTAWSFAICRFLIGIGEAPASPNTAKIVSSWMGSGGRAIGTSFHIIGIGLGGSLSPVLVTWMSLRWGWRMCFYVTSALGACLALSWWLFATDRPEQHPGVNAAELDVIRSANENAVSRVAEESRGRTQPPWGRMLSSVSVWAILLSYFCQGYTPYIFVTWFFIYLERVRGLTMMKGGLWGSTPFIAIIAMAPLGGWFSDRAVAKLGRRLGRKTAVWLGMGCSALLLWAGSHAVDNTAAILMLALAAGFNHFAVPTWWATCIDLAPNYSGSLSGLMNTFGGAWLAPILTAYIATRYGWIQALDFAALLTGVGAVLWLFVNADQSLETPSSSSPA